MTRDQRKNLNSVSECIMFFMIVIIVIICVVILQHLDIFKTLAETEAASNEATGFWWFFYILIALLMFYFWVIKPFRLFFKDQTWPHPKSSMLQAITRAAMPWAVVLGIVFLAISLSLEALERTLPDWTEVPILIVFFGILIAVWKWTESKRKSGLKQLIEAWEPSPESAT